jgi:hypothetical protein
MILGNGAGGIDGQGGSGGKHKDGDKNLKTNWRESVKA